MDVGMHYDSLLALHYTWIYGGFETKIAENRAFFERHGIRATRPDSRALDLGAGSGFQSIPLADAGFAVTAVDFSTSLLAELAEHAGDRRIETVPGDIATFPLDALAPDLVVCMGDTLTHLADETTAFALVARVARALAPGGRLVLTFRDLGHELTGPARFIPVRSEADRIFTCFLEYKTEHVIVHDIVHARAGDGGWTMRVGSYAKAIINPERLAETAAACGLRLEHLSTERGLVEYIGRKPSTGR